jgi:hypothetical protein
MSIIAHSRACDPSGRLSRRARASGLIVGAAAVALLASAHTLAPQEQHACAVVMGLDPSGDSYDTCIRSLDRSLSEWDQGRLIQIDRSACAKKALEPGTPAFAVCVVNAKQSP